MTRVFLLAIVLCFTSCTKDDSAQWIVTPRGDSIWVAPTVVEDTFVIVAYNGDVISAQEYDTIRADTITSFYCSSLFIRAACLDDSLAVINTAQQPSFESDVDVTGVYPTASGAGIFVFICEEQ